MAGKPVAGDLYESITGKLFEIGRQLRQKSGYPFDPVKLDSFLQRAVEGEFVLPGYEIDWHPIQKGGGCVSGTEIKKAFEIQSEWKGRAFSINSNLVRHWFSYPETYPTELRKFCVILWGSLVRTIDDEEPTKVHGLKWDDERNRLESFIVPIKGAFGFYLPALLKPKHQA